MYPRTPPGSTGPTLLSQSEGPHLSPSRKTPARRVAGIRSRDNSFETKKLDHFDHLRDYAGFAIARPLERLSILRQIVPHVRCQATHEGSASPRCVGAPQRSFFSMHVNGARHAQTCTSAVRPDHFSSDPWTRACRVAHHPARLGPIERPGRRVLRVCPRRTAGAHERYGCVVGSERGSGSVHWTDLSDNHERRKRTCRF